MKRNLSDSDSDCDDFFDDRLRSGSPSQSCHLSDRKRRRGVIEKRRRDRINASLLELRRLVPSAFEKQGSSKLEKAEILQMTVDHLKLLHQKGMPHSNYDPHIVARDYRCVGFKECAAEVARYLVTVEGLDLHDPMRMRLLNHLHCFSTREVSIKPPSLPSVPQPWSSMPPAPAPCNSHYSPMMTPTGGPSSGTQPAEAMTSHSASSVLHSFADVGRHSGSEGVSSTAMGGGVVGVSPYPRTAPSGVTCPASSAPLPSALSPSLLPSFPHHQTSTHQHLLPSIPGSYQTTHSVPSSGFAMQPASAGLKPYRPWGGELAY